VTDDFTLRRLESQSDYDEAVALQEETWGAGFTDRVPAAILRVAQKVGGVSAGAFDAQGRLVGFVFGLTGVRDGRLVHWSDMLAVRDEARGRHLGERLKHYQRALVRAVGVDLMYWTFDPLVARNAHFNLNRLGAVVAEYVPDLYGSNTGSVLHGTLPTDRFIARWDLADPDPAATPRNAATPASTAGDAPHAIVAGDSRVQLTTPLPDAPGVRVRIPHDIERVLATDPDAALAWRLATRDAFRHYLARGYRVTGFDRGDANRLPSYELTRPPHPAA
jgi:predicted GNAT superfamily acetyltransferase